MEIEGKTKDCKEKKVVTFIDASLRKGNWNKTQVRTKEVPTGVMEMKQMLLNRLYLNQKKKA